MDWQTEFEACALLTEKGDFANAVTGLEKLLQAHGDNSLALYLLAVNHAQLNQPQPAIAHLQRLEQKGDLTAIGRELLDDLLRQTNATAPTPASTPSSTGLKLNFGAAQSAPPPSPAGLKLNFGATQSVPPQSTPSPAGLRLNFGGTPPAPATPPVGLQVNFNAGPAQNLGAAYNNDFGPQTLLRVANTAQTWAELLTFSGEFREGDAARWDKFYRDNQARFGDCWYYADIFTITYAAAKIIQPKNYLDLGTDYGRNLIAAIKACPTLNFVACENWDARTSTPENVRDKLVPLNMPGKGKFLQGLPENLLPKLFQANPQLTFDLITMDNLTSPTVEAILLNILPRLNHNGVIALANLNRDRNLINAWRNAIGAVGGFAVNEFSEVGAGVAMAVKIA